jgi:hypothetical protein
MAALVKQLHRAAGAFSSRLDGPWSSVVVPCRCVTAGRSATDKGQVAYEGRTFNKLSRLKSSSRIRGAVIADANELEAVDAFNEESTTTAGHSIFPAPFKASSKGSHCDRNIRATMGDKDNHGGLRRQGTSQFLGVRQRHLAVCREEIKSPASRFRMAAGRENDFRFRPRNETLRPHLSYRRRIRAARQTPVLCQNASDEISGHLSTLPRMARKLDLIESTLLARLVGRSRLSIIRPSIRSGFS